MSQTSVTELLIGVLAGLLRDARHVAVGAASPLPGAAALLARRLQPAMRVTLLHSRRHNHFSDGGRELFDCAAQGRIDRFFLGGVQIDGSANINLVGSGGVYPRLRRRFPGSFGSAYLYFLVPRVILFREEHSRRALVPKVDFISAPGTSPPGVYRPGGPYALVTGRCVMSFERHRGRFALQSLHPGESLQTLREHTGFDFDCAENPAVTPAPERRLLELIRGPVREELAESYPEFVRQRLTPV